MSLKQSIVIHSEFSMKTKGGAGTRGSSPSGYIDYMTRDPACEPTTPVKLRNLDSISDRYQVRADIADAAESVPEMKHKMKQAQQRSGVAFCNNNVSMSQEDLTKKKREMEHAFQQQNKTWIKTVISFSPEYLEEMGIVPPGFECKKRGGYRGHVDQMKLRMAIMNGLDKMSKDYDNLQFVGTIQVDTWHVHCHLSMMDMGSGRLMPDGTQKGKLDATAKQRLRRGLDDFLDEHHMTRQMSSNVQHDKRNTVCFIKRFTHEVMDERSLPQFLMACLPEDKRLWRANCNRPEMKKPNYIVRGYVNELLQRSESGYRSALESVDRYARRRQEREGLTDEEYRQMYRIGQKGIIDDCINGVYSVLKRVPNREQTVRTPMMVAMAQSYEAMAAEAGSDPMIEFGFKLRSYANRLDHHKQEKHKYETLVKKAETQNVDETAKPFVDFLKFERDYNAMLMSKYQHFLAFLPGRELYEDEFLDLVKMRKKAMAMQQMLEDRNMARMTPDNAENYGRRVYDLRGGRFMRGSPEILQSRSEEMQQAWLDKAEVFQSKLADHGMLLETGADDKLRVKSGTVYAFQDVKALDLHHLGYDFPIDVRISKFNADRFADFADERYALFQKARDYLVKTGQEQGVSLFSVRDIENMKALADKIRVNPVVVKNKPISGGRKAGRTFRLDLDFKQDMDLAVRLAVDSQIEMLK